MKTRYEMIMDHIEVTDDMRARIMERTCGGKRKGGAMVRRIFTYRNYLSAAACAVVLIAGAMVFPGLLNRTGGLPEQTANPPLLVAPAIADFASARELSAAVGFEIRDLTVLPFEVESAKYQSNSNLFAQITYTGADRQAVYRKAAGNQDISGDYNVYDTVGEAQAGGSAVTLKGNGGVYSLAVWSDGTYSYSLSLDRGVSNAEWENIFSENEFSNSP